MNQRADTPHGWWFPKHKWVLDEHDGWSSLFHRVRRHCSDCGKRQEFVCTFEYPISECPMWGDKA